MMSEILRQKTAPKVKNFVQIDPKRLDAVTVTQKLKFFSLALSKIILLLASLARQIKIN